MIKGTEENFFELVENEYKDKVVVDNKDVYEFWQEGDGVKAFQGPAVYKSFSYQYLLWLFFDMFQTLIDDRTDMIICEGIKYGFAFAAEFDEPGLL